MWREIKPARHQSREWQFAEYMEFPHERSDGKCFTAFLFKNRERTLFGIQEWLGDERPHNTALRKLAAQVIIDEAFRKSLLSARPELPKWWKKR